MVFADDDREYVYIVVDRENLRKKESERRSGKVCTVDVVDVKENWMTIRLTFGVKYHNEIEPLKCIVREKLMEHLMVT